MTDANEPIKTQKEGVQRTTQVELDFGIDLIDFFFSSGGAISDGTKLSLFANALGMIMSMAIEGTGTDPEYVKAAVQKNIEMGAARHLEGLKKIKKGMH